MAARGRVLKAPGTPGSVVRSRRLGRRHRGHGPAPTVTAETLDQTQANSGETVSVADKPPVLQKRRRTASEIADVLAGAGVVAKPPSSTVDHLRVPNRVFIHPEAALLAGRTLLKSAGNDISNELRAASIVREASRVQVQQEAIASHEIGLELGRLGISTYEAAATERAQVAAARRLPPQPLQ